MFTTGACIQWLRDGIKVITAAADTELMARRVADNGGVYFVPALSGLGAPHWDMSARGAFFGITGGVQREHMVRSVLEAIAYQVKEVVQAINQDSGTDIALLKVDGGACQNDFLMQFQADVFGYPRGTSKGTGCLSSRSGICCWLGGRILAGLHCLNLKSPD
jgi:glycerol kinase